MMAELSARSVVIPAVSVLGVLAIGFALVTLDVRAIDPAFYALLVGMAAFAQRTPVPLFRSGSVSVAFAPAITAYVLYGPAAGVLVAAASAAVAAVTPRRKPLAKILYNVGALCGSAFAAGHAYALINGAGALEGIAGTLLAVAFSALAYFTLNTSLVAIAIALTTTTGFTDVWRTNYGWAIANYLATATNGGALALAYTSLGGIGAATFVLPLIVAWYSYKLYMTKSSEVRARNEELSNVNEQLRDSNGRLEHQAFHDTLTGLPNRALLRDRIGQEVAAARRHGNGFTLLVVDLDGFKAVNDTFGHDAGDDLLIQIGDRVRGALRGQDTLARLGGDEFALVLPETDVPGAEHVARTFTEALERPFDVKGHEVVAEASVGIAAFPQHGETPEDLLRHADVAMYVSKRSRGTITVYRPEHDENSADQVSVLAELRRAIRGGELFLRYQPIMRMDGRRIETVEALVRWKHPRRGVLSPTEFIPLAEQTGLIKPLFEWVLATALKDARAWSDAGEPIGVSVNTSMRNLLDPDLMAMVARALAGSGVPAQRLRLEITESVIMADPELARETITNLRAMGIRVSIDDFGTGYSSLSYLQRLPVSEVKIDKSFVGCAATDQSCGAIVRATIDLARTLGLEVVAEGVEDDRTWQMLAGAGCHAAQGYLIAVPLPASEVLTLARPRAIAGASLRVPSRTLPAVPASP